MTDRDPTFDLAAHAEELAEMRRVQDEIDAESRPRKEQLAEAIVLLALCDDVRAERFKALKRAESALGRALNATFKARDELDKASDLEIQAMEAVSLLRGEKPGAVDRAMAILQEQL